MNISHFRTLVFVLAGVLVMAGCVVADPDPADDTFGTSGAQIDLTDVTAVMGSPNITFTCTFAQPVARASADAPNSVGAFIDIDTDQNLSTGSTTALDGWAGLPDVELGVEYEIDIGSEYSHPGTVEVLVAPSFTSVGTVPITFGTSSFTVSVPRSMIGNPIGGVYFGVLVGNSDGPTDRWPNMHPLTPITSILDMGNNTPVWLSDQVITASFDDCFYIEAVNRNAGIKVLWPAPPPAGTLVGVSGISATAAGPERAVQASKVTLGPEKTLGPLFMAQKALGGWHSSLLGFPDNKGLYNVGLLVRTAGTVTYLDPGNQFAYIDDGSGLCDGNTLGPDSTAVTGVKVMLPAGYSIPAPPGFAAVTGVITAAPGPVRVLRVVP